MADMDWTNLSYANVATTSPVAYARAQLWADALARGGAAEFDGEAERTALVPLREATASLLNCAVENVCVGSSASELLASVAWAIAPGAGENVVSTSASFPSVVYPFQRASDAFGGEIRLAEHDSDSYTEPDEILALIDNDTVAVVLSHVEYINGQRYELARFREAAEEAGALLVVDATQSIGVLPIDAPESGIDVFVASGYKWLRGPFGAAVGFMGPSALALTPGLVGFRSHADLWDLRADRLDLPEDASRFEYATINFGAALGLSAAVQELCDQGIDDVWSHSLGLTERVIAGVLALGMEVASPLGDAERSGIVALRPSGLVNAAELASRLQTEYGIVVSSRAGLVRVSPHIDNTTDDIDSLLVALQEIIGSYT